MPSVLVATGNKRAASAIKTSLSGRAVVAIAADRTDFRFRLDKDRPELVFAERSWIEAFNVAEPLYNRLLDHSACRLVVLAAPSEMSRAVELVKAGAFACLTYPLAPGDIARIPVEPDRAEGAPLPDRIWEDGPPAMLRSKSPAMHQVYDKVRLVASTDTTVLITGETGTGKGVIARLIHGLSSRGEKPFLQVHCGAIPEALIESELFGHERGAFTGAVRRKQGRFESAAKGSIFLDEIGTVTAATQIKLLQVLQDRTFQPVGGERNIEADVRILAASNSDLEDMCRRGEFRTDLYYRLNVFPIHLPPLKQRTEDLEMLIDFFLKHLNQRYARRVTRITPEVLDAFRRYPWPGNVRELENLIERAFILEKADVIGKSSFPPDLFGRSHGDAPTQANAQWPLLAQIRREAVEQAEKAYLVKLLGAHAGRMNPSAQAAGISPRQLRKLLARHGIDKAEFKRKRGKGS